MSRTARLLGRLMVATFTVALLVGLGPAALAGGPIHDPNVRGFPVPSVSLAGAPAVVTRGSQGLGWLAQGATLAVLAVAVLVWLLAWGGRRHAHALAGPR